ncbi:acylneuraminate cytidylyltransferase family protein [Polynucleobacter paneuropaeus]|nr:acylneuraminate cytidylyltransferase family protein [Polynucleobacter paneuropaeus]
MALNNVPVICLIPARGGSKGVPRKNMRKIAGKALIDFSIFAAQHSKYIDNVYVSSDDGEILSHAKTIGTIGIVRPEEFAADASSAVEVVSHFISVLPRPLLMEDPYIIYLQPTSPLRTAVHIDDAFKRMEANPGKPLVSVAAMEKSPFKSFILSVDGCLQSLFDEKLSNARRQDLPAVFIPNGAIYIFRVSEFKSRGGFPSNGSIPFIMSQKDSLDIDTDDDIHCAEIILGVGNGRI